MTEGVWRPAEELKLLKVGASHTKALRLRSSFHRSGMVMNSTAVTKAVPRFLYDGNNFPKVEKVPLGFQSPPERSA